MATVINCWPAVALLGGGLVVCLTDYYGEESRLGKRAQNGAGNNLMLLHGNNGAVERLLRAQ